MKHEILLNYDRLLFHDLCSGEKEKNIRTNISFHLNYCLSFIKLPDILLPTGVTQLQCNHAVFPVMRTVSL